MPLPITVVQLLKLQLMVNVKAAKVLGLAPASLLAGTHEGIE